MSLHGCAPRVIDSFIRKGTVAAIEGNCLERIPRPLFALPLGVMRDAAPPRERKK